MFDRWRVCGARCVVLCDQVTGIWRRLIARVVFFAIERVGCPVFVLFMRFTFKICRFKLGPGTRFGAIFLYFDDRASCTVQWLVDYFCPITRPLVIATTEVFIDGPAVIRRRRVCARFLNFIRRASRFLFIRVGVDDFPIIGWNRAYLVAIFCLVITYPVVRVATNLSFSVRTVHRMGLQYTRCLSKEGTVF